MTITGFFHMLRAPLKNSRWSWGAIRPSDGAVFLRVWRDQKLIEQDTTYVKIIDAAWRPGVQENHAGYRERQSHVATIRQGAPCYLIMCRAKDPKAAPRRIESFYSAHVFRGGSLIERDGVTYIQEAAKLTVAELLA